MYVRDITVMKIVFEMIDLNVRPRYSDYIKVKEESTRSTEIYERKSNGGDGIS